MLNVTQKKVVVSVLLFFFLCNYSLAQPVSRVFFTTGAGVISADKAFKNILKPGIGFNSGLEITTNKNWFLQLTGDINTFRYDQQLIDDNSAYLFQKSNSPLLMLGLNAGKNFVFGPNAFASLYLGEGYLAIGEPRVTVERSVIKQEIYRHRSYFTRAGTRIAYTSPIKFLQVLYLDANWWKSGAKLQNHLIGGYSIFIGSRMGM